MKVCANCGKSNLPTRKFCIRCGRSLITASSKSSTKSRPAPEIPELGRTVTGASMEAGATTEPPPPVDEEEEWVKPSQVPKDRVRTTTTKRKTELEKAKEAFKRADKVGIDEDGTGVIEARMLRASEVRELMEGVSEMAPATPDVQPSDVPEVTPPPIEAPSPQAIEEQILGSMSAYVDKPVEPPEEEPFSESFTSSRYTEPVTEAPAPAVPDMPKDPETALELTDETITTCPHCGEIVNIDSFEYPKEIYSAMGSARIKQARFFVVQGKYEEAQKVVRIARSLFLKADDTTGLTEVNKLVDSLARRN